jgi:flagellar motility protein MotE (MotC chaperone)
MLSRFCKILLLLAVVKLGIAGAVVWEEFRASYPVAEKPAAEKAREPVLTPSEAFAQEEAAENATARQSPDDRQLSLNPRELQRKEEDLRRREQELKELEKRIDAKLKNLSELEGRLQKMLEEADVLKDKKLRHLVDVYSNMKAKQAAAVLETLDQEIAVKILAGMRGRQAGEILTYVEAGKAAKLSEALTRLQTPFEN